MIRTGIGFDAHRLAKGRPLILGGVLIPHRAGLEGHSDADVLAHAIADALLGAAGAGDIGTHFPDNDPAWAGADSVGLILRRVAEILREKRVSILNVDSVIIAQEPRLAPYFKSMSEKMAEALGTGSAGVSVKAKTTEVMGFTGRREGIAAIAVACVEAPG